MIPEKSLDCKIGMQMAHIKYSVITWVNPCAMMYNEYLIEWNQFVVSLCFVNTCMLFHLYCDMFCLHSLFVIHFWSVLQQWWITFVFSLCLSEIYFCNIYCAIYSAIFWSTSQTGDLNDLNTRLVHLVWYFGVILKYHQYLKVTLE